MRKKRLMIAIACIILVGIAVIVFFSQQGKKPYKDLDAAQIVSAIKGYEQVRQYHHLDRHRTQPAILHRRKVKRKQHVAHG